MYFLYDPRKLADVDLCRPQLDPESAKVVASKIDDLLRDCGRHLGGSEVTNLPALYDALDHDGDGDVIVVGEVLGFVSILLLD